MNKITYAPIITDIKMDLQLIDMALRKKDEFKEFNNKAILQYIIKKASEMTYLINKYLAEDKLYIHYIKKNLLRQILAELNHFYSSANYYINYNEYDANKLSEILLKINNYFSEYAKFGSVYLLRHCTKQTRQTTSGNPYSGISTPAVKEEAMRVAEEIFQEILISPKNVTIYLSYSEYPRTRIFGEIITRRAIQANHYCDNKVSIVVAGKDGYDYRIGYGYWSEAAIKEVMPLVEKRGEYEVFISWLDNIGEVKSMIHQPKPDYIASQVLEFIKYYHDKANTSSDQYVIAIGISHSWVIDTLLHTMIPELRNHVSDIIKTAGFCKAECGEFNYMGKWVKLN